MKKALAVVAHPDDETIWMGGTILKNKNWEWTIVALCRGGDEDRAPKFEKACKEYNARAIISNLDDEKLDSIPIEEVIKKIKSIVPKNNYDFIFTHGENGEYGHIRHKEVHVAVKKMVKDKELKSKENYYFCYIPGNVNAPHDNQLKIPIPNIKSDYIIELNKEEFKRKFLIITKLYGFSHPNFETLSCSKMEAFSKF